MRRAWRPLGGCKSMKSLRRGLEWAGEAKGERLVALGAAGPAGCWELQQESQASYR